jgi:long-subunit fatty acid transport protein
MMFRVGATWSMSQQLTEKSSFYQVAIHNFSDTLVNDTNYSESEKKGKLTMPGSYSVGVALAKSDKWMFGIDYTSTNWGDFNSTPDTTRNSGLATSTYKVAIGGQITPNAADINSYFPRVTYRAGFYYGTENIRLQNTATTTYGITFGGSFPFKRNIRTVSRVHASFDIGKMGTTANNLLQQTYIRFGFGFTFNEKWFIPRKYD